LSNLLLESASFEVSRDPQGRLRLASPGRVLEAVPGVEFTQRHRKRTLAGESLAAGRDAEAQLEDAHGQAHGLEMAYQELQGMVLAMELRLYAGRPFVLCRLAATNVGADRVQLRRFFLRTRRDGLVTTEPPLGAYVSGWQARSPSGFQPVGSSAPVPRGFGGWRRDPLIHNARTPRWSQPNRFWSEMVGALVTQREALIGGIVSTADQFGQMSVDLRPGRVEVLLQTQLDNVLLEPGESRRSEWFYLEWVPLPNVDPFAQYAHAVARQMGSQVLRNGVVERGGVAEHRVLTGWCSWARYGRGVSEGDMMENLASAALLADTVPLAVLQLDQGYELAWGDWLGRNDRFPHTLAWLADRIKGSGFTPGLWLAPLVVGPRSEVARANPGWLLRDAVGRPVRVGSPLSYTGRALDPTHPGVADYLREVVDTIVHEWGYTYLKLDHMAAGALPGTRSNPEMTRAQALRQAYRVIREAAGDEVYLTAGGSPFGPAIGLVDAMRVSPDPAPRWAPRLWRLGGLLRRNFALPSMRNTLRGTATRAWMHGRLWVNDPGTLLMGDQSAVLTEDEVRAQVTMVGLNGGLAFLSDDLDDMSPERRAMAAVLFPPLLDGLDALDLFSEAMPEIVVVPVARPWGRWRLVGLFNWTAEPVERDLPEAVTLNERKAYHVVDFWEQRYFLMGPGALRPVLHIPPHGVVLLGLRAVKPDPQLVATSFHISQGGEVTQWSVGKDALQVTLDIGRQAQGAVWLALPRRPHDVRLEGLQLPDSAVRAVAWGVWSVGCEINQKGTLSVSWDEVARSEAGAPAGTASSSRPE